MEEKNEEKREYFRVSGADILKKIEDIIKEGNARKIIIKNEKDETIMEFPVTVGVVGVVLAPILAAVGAIAALAANYTIVVERK
jgi:repressor of nif and glnA expression